MRSICLHDLDFGQVPLTRRSTRGLPYQQWVRVGMPRIPENVIHSISTNLFVRTGANPYCVGDDTFMIGLFLDHAGVTTNVPSARFGNISMLPNPRATIRQSTGYDGVSYVVDMHSRTGFSGSPVF